MTDLMSKAQALARLELIRKSDTVEVISAGAELKLSGTFNVDDLEALYVLMLFGELPPKSGAPT
jgi:hypothetical protein